MTRWIEIARRKRVLFVAAGVLLWTIAVFGVVPWLIRSAYAGESLTILNRIIEGRDRHGVEWYLSLWWRLAAVLTLVLIGVAVIAYRARSAWSALRRHLRHVARAWAGEDRVAQVASVAMLAVVVGAVGGLAEAVNGIVRHRVRHLPTGEFVAGELFWLAPLAAIATLLSLGLLLAGLDRALRTRGLLLGATPYVLVAVVVFSFMRALTLGLANWAAALFAAGASAAVVRLLMRDPSRAQRALGRGAVAILTALLVWAAALPIARRTAERRALASLPAARPGAPNVLILIWDAVRAPNLSAYGYGRRTTPALERLTRRGVLFERAFSTAPWSLPSHASIFTGRNPPEMSAGYESPLGVRHPTLAEVLSREGYVTGGFTGNLFFGSADYGIARGFAQYDSRPPLNVTTVLHTWWASRIVTQRLRWRLGLRQTMLRRSAADVSGAFRRWVRRHDDRPFLAVLNHFDAHEPYLPPEPFRLAFSDRAPRYWLVDDKEVFTDEVLNDLETAYDTCILYLDYELQKLLDFLEAEGVLDNTMIIITSDHGEEFGEYDRRVVAHWKTLHTFALHVPLVIVPPGGTQAERRSEVVSIRDIPTTVMDVLGLAERSPFPGVALLRDSAATDPWSNVRVATAEKYPWGEGNVWPSSRGDMFSLFAGDWHYIRGRKHGERLYDIARDPWEKNDRAADPKLAPIMKRFRALLAAYVPLQHGVRRARRFPQLTQGEAR